MATALVGLVLDSSVLIAAERRRLTLVEAIESVKRILGEIPLALSALTVAEIGHGIYRASASEVRQRRRLFLESVKAALPVHPITEVTAKIVAQIGGEQAAKGINLPLGDLIIGACTIQLGYAVGTGNLRDFGSIPGLTVVPL